MVGPPAGEAGLEAETSGRVAVPASARADPTASAPAGGSAPRPRAAGRPQSTSRLVLVGVLLGLTALGATVLTGKTSLLSGGSTPSGSNSSARFEPPRSAAWMQTFAGVQFSLLYPMGWFVERAETSPEGVEYLDTTIRRVDGDPHYLIRVDVAQDGPAPVDTVEEVVQALQGEPGFQQVSYQSTTVRLQDGTDAPALSLEFLLTNPDTGLLMHSVDVFFQASGRSYAVLTRSPADQWSTWSEAFALIRNSIDVG